MPLLLRPLLRAAFLLTLGLPPGWLAAATFQDDIAQRTLACTACHGKQGRAAPDGYYPRIAGKPAGYLYNQLLNFRDGRRHYGLMQRMVDPLNDAYLGEIAGYFGALEVSYPAPVPTSATPEVLARGEALVRRGAPERDLPACVQCHGERMTGALPAVPGLLGLPLDYLNAQLGAWRTGERRAQSPDCMKSIAQQMQPEDVHAVASWLSAQPLPADPHPALRLPAAMPLECGSAALAMPPESTP